MPPPPRQRDVVAGSARATWSCATTAAPSPIAPPIRLTEPDRTSPTANTPGRFDSRGNVRRAELAARITPRVSLRATSGLDGRGPVPAAAAPELLEAGDGRPPVASAAGHDGRPGFPAATVRQLEGEGSRRAIEPHGLVGN